MKTTTLIGLCFLTVLSCQTKIDNKIEQRTASQEIEGELYFKLISLGSFYDFSDSTIWKFESMIDSLSIQKNISEQDQELIRTIKLLKENQLIHKPYFHLKIDSTQLLTVYLNEEEYQKVKQFDRQKLINENKKVAISLKGRILEDGIVDGYEILSTKKVDGKTYWRK